MKPLALTLLALASVSSFATEIPSTVQGRSEQTASEVKALKARANAVSNRVADVMKGDSTSDESVKLLQELVDELKQINARLKQLQDGLDTSKKDITALQRFQWRGYAQFQFGDTEEGPNSLGGTNRTNNDGFTFRRIRLSATHKMDDRTQLKVSLDAGGSQRTSVELRDAQIRYDITKGISAYAGQELTPLGYELERSSSEREMPERSIYNRTLFAGDRMRGAYLRGTISPGVTATLGVMNGLTISDPQQGDANRFGNLSGTALAGVAGIRFTTRNSEVGLGGMVGQRPGTAGRTITNWTDSNNNGTVDVGEVRNTIVPATGSNARRFVYVDGALHDLVNGLTLRGELMLGRDRVPTLNNNVPIATTDTSVLGYHLQATYAIDAKNALTARYESFDPDTGIGGNTQSMIGLSLAHFLSPDLKLSLTHEWFKEQPFNARNNAWTLRVQYRIR